MSNTKLGPTQRAVMVALGQRERHRGRAAEIAEQIDAGLTPNAVACALHRLEARGLVRTLDEHRTGAPAIWTRT